MQTEKNQKTEYSWDVKIFVRELLDDGTLTDAVYATLKQESDAKKMLRNKKSRLEGKRIENNRKPEINPKTSFPNCGTLGEFTHKNWQNIVKTIICKHWNLTPKV
jgi:DNA polymerase sigma